MQDELEDNHEDYFSILHEEWCELLSTIEVRVNTERYATHIKRLATSKAIPNYDSNKSIRVPHNKMVSTSALPNFNQKGGEMPKHHGDQRYCMLCKKSGIPE